MLGNDITSPVAINEMKKMKDQTVFDKEKIALVMDHFIPNKDIKSAENCKCCRDFANVHGITNYFDVGDMGIEHALLPEKGTGDRRGCGDRRRFPYVYLRSPGRLLHRSGEHRHGGWHGHGKGLV